MIRSSIQSTFSLLSHLLVIAFTWVLQVCGMLQPSAQDSSVVSLIISPIFHALVTSLGYVLIGVVISIFLYGIITLQAFIYFRHYPQWSTPLTCSANRWPLCSSDRLVMKLFVRGWYPGFAICSHYSLDRCFGICGYSTLGFQRRFSLWQAYNPL